MHSSMLPSRLWYAGPVGVWGWFLFMMTSHSSAHDVAAWWTAINRVLGLLQRRFCGVRGIMRQFNTLDELVCENIVL